MAVLWQIVQHVPHLVIATTLNGVLISEDLVDSGTQRLAAVDHKEPTPPGIQAARDHVRQRALLDHIRKFLLELGAGFAFVGQQMHLEVGGEDFYLDLLFYHLRLRCFVVIDLKARPFKPEHAGKMNFYLSAVDDLLRHPDDKPSIGLILCKTRNKIVAEYALRDMAKPVGVARYVTRLVEKLPARLKGALPAPRDIEAELGKSKNRGPEKVPDIVPFPPATAGRVRSAHRFVSPKSGKG